jgi:hypothetical protein
LPPAYSSSSITRSRATFVRVDSTSASGFRFVERRLFGKDECAVYRLDRPEYERTLSEETTDERAQR